MQTNSISIGSKPNATKEANSEADKNAEKILESKTYPNFGLIKVRYAIDGGYYSLAEKSISGVKTAQLEAHEVFELEYRKARLFHLMGDDERALVQYQKVIANAEVLPETYFVPNAYLQIGYLHMEMRDYSKARMYFEKVLEFDNHAYKSSLDSKAKIALNALDSSGG